MKKQLYRFAAVLLAAAILLGGCTIGADTAWVYSSQGTLTPAGLYITHQINAVGDARDIIYEQSLTDSTLAVPATAEELLRFTIEEKPAQQWLEERTLQYAKLYYYAGQRFSELALEWTDDLQMIVDYSVESTWAQTGPLLEENGISQESFRLNSINDVKLQRIFETLYGEGGEFEVPFENLRQKFAEDYASIDWFGAAKPVTIPEGSDKTTLEDAAAEVKALLDSYIPRLEAGEPFEDLYYEFEVAQAKLNLADESAIVKRQPGEMTEIIDKTQTELYPPELYHPTFIQQILTSAAGDIKVVDTPERFYLVRVNDILEQEELLEENRLSVLHSLKYEDFRTEAFGLSGSVTFDVNQKAVNRYKLSRLKLS